MIQRAGFVNAEKRRRERERERELIGEGRLKRECARRREIREM
jgi:hypothetical protein